MSRPVPFVRTPTNLLKYAVERSPIAPILKEWRADFMAGGAKRDLAVAKALVGSGVGASVTLWAANGKITGGGPADENATRLMRADGRRDSVERPRYRLVVRPYDVLDPQHCPLIEIAVAPMAAAIESLSQ